MKLQVNGKAVEVDVTKFSYAEGPDTLRITTAGDETLVVRGSDPAPDPTPDPAPDPTPDPNPGTPDDVILRHHYTEKGREMRGFFHTIPKGMTVSSRIPAETGKKIYYQQNDSIKPRVDVWLSKTPGGEPLGRYCQTKAQNRTPKVKFKTEGGFPWHCRLDPRDFYYVNIRHTDPDHPASEINRKIYQ